MPYKNNTTHTRLLIALFAFLSGFHHMSAQEKQRVFQVEFRTGHATLETSFGSNAHKLDSIVAALDRLASTPTLQLLGITLSGGASPEGSAALNRNLALKRMQNLETWLRRRAALPPDSLVRRDTSGIDWQWLETMVSRSDMPRKDRVLDVLSHSAPPDRNARLKAIDGGHTWQYLLDTFFPAMRNARIVCAYTLTQDKDNETPADNTAAADATDTINIVDTVRIVDAPVAVLAADSCASLPQKDNKPFYMAVKTNMLYDALAVPNIGVEFYLKKGWSLAGEWMAAWWNKDSRHRYWRIAGGHLAVRKWLGRKAEGKPLTGHHLGIYAQGLTYDVEWGGTGYMGGKPGGHGMDKINYAAGVEYGFSLPVARRLNIDFTLGAGYWGGTYHKYTPQDGHYVWQGTFKRRWFGPTNVEVGLVWLLGRGNVNAGKGGGR